MVKGTFKRGDTLIEVMLAVGIFSLVAIAVVAVMSGGTSSAQTALESTLAREEIDTQAEALRFIQSAYVADRKSRIGELWEVITADDPNNSNNVNVIEGESDITNIMQYSPSNCGELYGDGKEATKYGFVINTSKLGNFDDAAEVIIKGKQKLSQAVTYPRLVFSDDLNGESLVDNGNSNIYSAEGIYIVAVRDPNTTNIVGEGTKTSAYYDFYIRTCWYGTGDSNPSTISTLIRLYDPSDINMD